MLLLTLLMVGVLLGIMVQDMLWRAVYLWVFPLLLILFIVAWFFQRRDVTLAVVAGLINISFLLFQFLLVSLYFYIKNKQIVKLTGTLIGWGDIFFLLCAAFYLSVLNFIFFYVISLMLALVCWLLWLGLTKSSSKSIPLAGTQALLMAILIVWDRFDRVIDLSSDSWLTIRLLKLA
ncbi:hypothetical protein ABIB62_004254 [Mucilaginibacter sp. UYP25]|uniref:hypothetical protein n=1 Tax=unclassified Mucilaginibacter TaxID=2617802 RepID=UPI0033969DF8